MRSFSGKYLRGLLVASLAVNLFFVGLISARAVLGIDLPGFGSRERSGFHALPHPKTLRAALPEKDQAALEATLAAHRDEVRGHFRELNAARQRVADAIRAVPFDPAALDAAFAELRLEDDATAASLHRMLSDLIVQLDDDSRTRVADTIRIWKPRDRKQEDEERSR